jgi:hypothetical protein
MDRYDLNIWDWKGYNSSYAEEGWRIDVYECDENWVHANDPEQIIYLSDTQARMLTLGLDESQGGDYGSDEDFWIDPLAFLDTYKNIPRKVRRYIESLNCNWRELANAS